MYNVPYFKETDRDEIMSFLRSHPFAQITGIAEDGKLIATHVPVLFDEREGTLVLTAHIMRNSDHWRGFSSNSEVLAVFNGPNCPVKASWYLGNESGGTWNYMAVHARGSARMLDQEALVTILRRLTAQVEGDPNTGANFDDLSNVYVNKMLPAIQAFEITVTELDAIFKLSQNKTLDVYDDVTRELAERDGDSRMIAGIMLERRDRLFPTR